MAVRGVWGAVDTAEGGAMMSKLRRTRNALGLTQVELAERSGVTQPYISEIECGARDLSWNVAQRLAPSLGVDPAALLEREGATMLPKFTPPALGEGLKMPEFTPTLRMPECMAGRVEVNPKWLQEDAKYKMPWDTQHGTRGGQQLMRLDQLQQENAVLRQRVSVLEEEYRIAVQTVAELGEEQGQLLEICKAIIEQGWLDDEEAHNREGYPFLREQIKQVIAKHGEEGE